MSDKKKSLITEVNDNADGQGSSTSPINEQKFGQPGEPLKPMPGTQGKESEEGDKDSK